MGQERKLVKQFDKDADGRLNRDERLAARESIKKDRAAGGRRRGGRAAASARPAASAARNGAAASPAAASSRPTWQTFPGKPLYEPTVLRTLFLEFADKDWEAEIADFYTPTSRSRPP